MNPLSDSTPSAASAGLPGPPPEARWRDEFEVAADFQRAVLPSPPPVAYASIQALCRPWGPVGGDLYDFVLSRERQLGVFVGDATGHGLVSAFVTMMVHLGLAGLRPDLGCSDVLRRLNALLHGRTGTNSVSAVYFRLDPEGRLSAAHAGHPPLLIHRAADGRVETLGDGGCPLGMFSDELVPWSEERFTLAPGDRLLAYTDGLSEWRDDRGAEFGAERIASAFREHAGDPIAALPEAIYARAEAATGGRPCTDDLTIVAAEFTGEA